MNKKEADTDHGGQHVIKKYPNRRLYDTSTSSYITLADIKAMVMGSEPFVVRDAKSGDDLTRSILLQIILEEEAAGTPMFTTPVLANIIRFYGHAMQGLMGGYLEKNMQSLQDMQTALSSSTPGATPEMWKQFMGMQAPVVQELLNKNLAQSQNLWGQMQAQMQKQTEQMLASLGVKR